MKAQESDQKIVLSVESILKKTKGNVSPEDLSVETGFPLAQINDALGRLIELYTARVTMDSDSGKLVFKFDYPLNKRGSKSFKEILYIVVEAIWKAFKVVYKASIGVILILYTVLFVLILIGLMVASSGNNNDRDRGFNVGPLIGGMFRGILDAFTWSLWMRPYYYNTDRYGNRFRVFEQPKDKGRGFIQSVYSFVFGPDRPAYDPLDDHKEAAAFIRKNNGKITAGHIVALTGVSYYEAESRLAEYASRFGGELYINNEAVLVGEFYELLNKQSDVLNGGRIVFYEDEVEAPYELTGNKSGRNAAIIGMNSFNLIMAFFLTSVFSGASQLALTDKFGDPINTDFLVNPFLNIAFGYFPLVFSVLFFIIPMVRSFYVKRKNKKRRLNIFRKKLIGSFVRNRDKDITLSEIMSIANIDQKHKAETKNVLEKLVVDLRGEININTQGEPVYSFKRLSTELGI